MARNTLRDGEFCRFEKINEQMITKQGLWNKHKAPIYPA